jgi:hypothetical protein
MRKVSLAAADYEGDAILNGMGLYFGIYLLEAATVKFTDMTGNTDTIALGAGYHPLQLTKIFKTGTTVTDIVIWY